MLLAGVLGVPVRLYQLTAVSLDYPDLGRKFRWLFPAVLLLDEVWAATPLLFLGQLQGAVLLCAAGLAYLPHLCSLREYWGAPFERPDAGPILECRGIGVDER